MATSRAIEGVGAAARAVRRANMKRKIQEGRKQTAGGKRKKSTGSGGGPSRLKQAAGGSGK